MELGVLGTLYVCAGGGSISLRPLERRLMCALTAMRGSPVRVDAMCQLVWGDDWPASARHSIQAHVGRLRASIGPGVVVTVPGGYQLGPDVTTDIDAFEVAQRDAVTASSAEVRLRRLEDALALWRGRPFDELDDWSPAVVERARLVELWQSALEARATARLAMGPDASVVAAAEELVAAEPLREPRWALLMTALEAVGRHGDALRAFDRARRVLAAELGISPGSELTQLYETIVRAEPPARTQERPPSGTVTFLLTDVEGSTRASEAMPEQMAAAIARHHALLDQVIAEHGGHRPIEQGEGDSAVAVFAKATDALAAAVAAQQRFTHDLGDVFRVCMALHTAEARLDGQFYRGEALNRTARIRACAHGGQILVSRPTADLLASDISVGVELVALGTYRLRGLARPEEVWQVRVDGLQTTFPPLVSTEAPRTNLPIARTALIGRDRERSALQASLVGGVRVVTLTGAGGVGKTRLALRVAADHLGIAPDGVWWVDLATLEPGGGVADAIVRALGFVESATVPAVDQLVTGLALWQALLVLDNCEHVVVDAARVVDRLTRTCPDLRVMATSREPLAIAGEAVWPVNPLPVPGPGAPAESVVDVDSVRLFLERAKQASPRFDVDDKRLAMVAEVCRRLDGIPLALELAAAHVRTTPLGEIVRELDDRFALLAGGARTALPRHQTMWASLEWSHDLLSEDEQRVFRRLWPFAGGFTVAAAVSVAGADMGRRACLDALSHLVDRSLVQLDEHTDRYHLLETMRQFADERAAAAGESESVRERHVGWVVEYLDGLDIAMLEDPALDAIDDEYPNIRVALESAIAQGSGQGATIVAALAQYWSIAGRLRDAVTLADPVLADLHERDPQRWAQIVARLGVARNAVGDIEFMANNTLRALDIARDAGDLSTLGHCLQAKGSAEGGDAASWEDAFHVAERSGDRRLAVILAALAPYPVLGTEEGERRLARARQLAQGVNISGSRYIPDGLGAIHAGLRGDLARCGQLARRCFDEKIRSPLMHLAVANAVTPFARQAGDRDLLTLIAEKIPDHWRDLPAHQHKFAILDHQLGSLDRLPAPLDRSLLPIGSSGLLLAEVVPRALLDDDRDDELAAWAEHLTDAWPWSRAAGLLGRAWVAHRRNEPDTRQRLASLIADTAELGLRVYASEAIELAGADLAPDHPDAAARLLAVGSAARKEMKLRWRFPYHQRTVTTARDILSRSLGAHDSSRLTDSAAGTGLVSAVQLATSVLV